MQSKYFQKAGMSLRQLAEVLNYNKSNLARIEADELTPETTKGRPFDRAALSVLCFTSVRR